MKQLAFEEKKFCRIRTLAERWECPIDRLIGLAQKGIIRFWHPEGKQATKGRLVEVASVLEAEKNGFIAPEDVN